MTKANTDYENKAQRRSMTFALNDGQEARYEAAYWYRYPRFGSVGSLIRYLND